MDAWDKAKEHGTEAPRREFAGFIKLQNPGEFVVGRIIGKDEGKFGHLLRMERADGMEFVTPVQTYLGRNFDLASLTGHVVAIAFTGQQDTGKQDKMKVFEVRDFGEEFPEDLPNGMEAEMENPEDLPF